METIQEEVQYQNQVLRKYVAKTPSIKSQSNQRLQQQQDKFMTILNSSQDKNLIINKLWLYIFKSFRKYYRVAIYN